MSAPSLSVSDVMTPGVHTLAPDAQVEEALRELSEHGWSGAVVVDEARRPIGVFSELDALRVLANAHFHGQPSGSVREHMSRAVMTATPEDDALTVALRLIGDGVRRYPVVDEEGRLVGLVTSTDLSTALSAGASGRRRAEHPPGAAWDPTRSRARDLVRGR